MKEQGPVFDNTRWSDEERKRQGRVRLAHESRVFGESILQSPHITLFPEQEDIRETCAILEASLAEAGATGVRYVTTIFSGSLFSYVTAPDLRDMMVESPVILLDNPRLQPQDTGKINVTEFLKNAKHLSDLYGSLLRGVVAVSRHSFVKPSTKPQERRDPYEEALLMHFRYGRPLNGIYRYGESYPSPSAAFPASQPPAEYVPIEFDNSQLEKLRAIYEGE